ncbi:MAG: Clp protease N-terminal domain-containing protein [Candidatus Acidiferrales bacterium]|jgi:ATP-dependent Clp protease ATP-binding subunit ClpC
MFERYTQDARRAIFLARDEAMRYGSPYIESEHFLLAVVRENEALWIRVAGGRGSLESLPKEIEARTTLGNPTSGPVDVPLSADSKKILLLAAEEAGELGHTQVRLEHFLLGILRIDQCVAAQILQAHGVTIGALREMLGKAAT